MDIVPPQFPLRPARTQQLKSFSLLLIQTVDGMQSANRKFGVRTVDQYRNLDLGGVMARMLSPCRQCLECGGGTAAWLLMPMPMTETFDMPASDCTTS